MKEVYLLSESEYPNDKSSFFENFIHGDENILIKPPMFVNDLSSKGVHYPFSVTESRTAEVLRLATLSIGDPEIRGIECIITGSNHIILRYEDEELARLQTFSQGLRDQFGSPNSGILVRGRRIFLEEKPLINLDGDYALISPEEAYNYGIWLLQVIPYVTHLQSVGFGGGFLCIAEMPWQEKFINFLGITPRHAKQVPGVAYKIEGSLTAFRHRGRNLVLSSNDRAAFDGLKYSLGGIGCKPYSEKIFVSRLSRSEINPVYRCLVNEKELIEALINAGFTIVEPELFEFDEQVRIFSNARVVVGLGGAGMFNCVFCKEGTTVVTIESSGTWIAAHSNLFGSLGLNYGIIFGDQIENDAGSPHAPWTLNVEAAMNALKNL